MKSLYRLHASIAIAVSLLSSCIESVSLDTVDSNTVVVNCILTNSEEIQTLTLDYIKQDRQEKSSPIKEADIVLYCNDNVAGTFVWQHDNVWTLAYSPASGKEYTIKIKVPGCETVEATTLMPESFEMRIMWDHSQKVFSRYDLLQIQLPTNALYWLYVIDGDTGKMAEYLATDHTEVDLFNISDLTVYTSSLIHNDTYLSKGHRVPEFYDPPLQQDYFLHKRYLRINQQTYERWKLSFIEGIGTDDEYVWTAASNTYTLCGTFADETSDMIAMRVAPELDKYIAEGFSNLYKEDIVDITDIYKAESSYTNVKGGAGIFSSAYIVKVEKFWNSQDEIIYGKERRKWYGW